MNEERSFAMVLLREPKWHWGHFWRLRGCPRIDHFMSRPITIQKAREDAQIMAEQHNGAVVLIDVEAGRSEQIVFNPRIALRVSISDEPGAEPGIKTRYVRGNPPE